MQTPKTAVNVSLLREWARGHIDLANSPATQRHQLNAFDPTPLSQQGNNYNSLGGQCGSIASRRRCWKTVMAFQSPPAEGRTCNTCGDVKSLNFFALDSHECRRCEESREQQALKEEIEA